MDQSTQLDQVLTKLGQGAYKRYSSHAYEAGYYHSLIQSMFRYLPAERKTALIDQLQSKCAEFERRPVAAP